MDSLNLALVDSFENFADNKAILINDEFITYKELGALSQNLARIIKKHNFIFIFGYRSFETYISISASVLTHTAFIPLNPNFPQERLETMIKRVDCNALILCKECVESFKKIANFIKPCVVYCFDDFDFKDEFKQHTFIVINNALSADSTYTKESTPLESTPAYLLFTSGSTGIPKGVLVSRGNLFSYVKRIQKIYNFSKLDRISQFFDITFDLSMHDIFCSFLSGTTLVVIPKNQLLNPLKYINKTQLTVLFAPPSFIAYLQKLKILKENVLPNLRAALFCGEALPSASAIAFSKAAPQASLDNLYGPTEATISFTFYRVKEAGISNKIQDLKGEDIIPLGLPLCGLKISIRDAENREVRNGEIGEILLGSKENSQIALGYYKDIEKTKEKFFSENGVQWYKTGDLGYFNATLNAYCFKGRIDEQVKIQGYRVELLEVDKALQIISGVQSRAVLLSENGLSVLIGVIEGIQDDKKAVEILCGLKKKLPFYMIPQKILFLESFPLNSNGKVDREAIKIKIQNILNAIISVTPPPPKRIFCNMERGFMLLQSSFTKYRVA
ncbi:MAG: AMP-binding protein [Helicobacteraceae bacterium]|nr:AMP-binding protein [Helicobacteraceae bacterium]